MTRALTGLAAWLAGTALAVCLAWLGANMVVRDAGVDPGVQVISAGAGALSAPAPSPPALPTLAVPSDSRQWRASLASGRATSRQPAGRAAARPSPSSSPSQTPSPSPSPSATPSTSPSPSDSDDGTVRGYALDGGRVALLLTSGSAELVTATPDSGFSVQTWSGTDWLRVDFSSGPQVSSLIVSWYEHAPTVTIES